MFYSSTILYLRRHCFNMPNNQNTVIKKEGRIIYISIARFVAMLMIITCHMLQYYKSELAFWFNVGVQVFFVISGFLYGRKDINSPIAFIYRRFKTILIPYWSFLLLAISCYLLLCPQELSMSSVVRAFTCSGTINGLGHLWFVGYILFCYLLTPYLYSLRQYTEKWSLRKTLLFYCFLLAVLKIIGFLFDSYFKPEIISCFILGFFWADLCKRLYSHQIGIFKWLVILIALLMNGVEIYIKYFTSLEFVGWQYTVFSSFCGYSHMFLGLIIFLLFYGRFGKAKYSWILRFSDKYSYPIYLAHLLFILSPLSLMSITDIKMINWLLVFIAILIAGVFVYHLSKWVESLISSTLGRVISI